MKINVLTPLTTLDNMPVWFVPPGVDDQGKITAEGVPMLLHHVLIQAAIQPPPQDKVYSPRHTVIRYALAIGTWKAKEKGGRAIINITPQVVEVIQNDICRLLPPFVGGQALVMLGYKLEDLPDLFGEEIIDLLRDKMAEVLGGIAKAA